MFFARTMRVHLAWSSRSTRPRSSGVPAAMRERFEAQGCDIVAGTPEDLGRVLREDQAKWAHIVRAKNITVE